MSRRKQLRPFKVHDDDDDVNSNSKQAKSADNGLSTSSNGHKIDEPQPPSKFPKVLLVLSFDGDKKLPIFR